MSFQEHTATHWFREHNLEISLLFKRLSVLIYLQESCGLQPLKGLRELDPKLIGIVLCYSLNFSWKSRKEQSLTWIHNCLDCHYTKNRSGFHSHLPSTLILPDTIVSITYYSTAHSLISDGRVKSIEHTCLTSHVWPAPTKAWLN